MKIGEIMSNTATLPSSSIFRQLTQLPLPRDFQGKAYNVSISRQLAIAFVLNILSLALPIMMLQVYDRIIPHQSYSTLAMLIIGLTVALSFDIGLRIARSYLTSWASASHEHIASCAALSIFSKSELSSFERRSSGEHLQNLSALGKLREFYSGQAWTALIDLPFAVIFLGLIAYLGGILVLVPIALLAVFMINAMMAGKALRSSLESRSHSDDNKASFVVSVLSGVHTVKALALESFLLRRFESLQTKISNDSYNVASASGKASILSAAFGQLSLILTVTAGFYLVLHGNLSVGGLSACTLLAGRAIQPVQRVLGTWLRLQDLSVARNHAENLFSVPTQIRKYIPLQSLKAQGRVVLEDICLGMNSNTEALLDHASLTVDPGDIIAISGDNNVSKSNLLQIIAGVLPPQLGTVRVDDINPAEHGLSEMSSLIGYLPQDGMIFRGTILENMSGFRNDDVSLEKAKEAGHELGIDKIIDLLPRGYQTMLFDTASDPIPPGVKQRVTLSRILMHKPSVLLFDQSDRALDKDGYNLLFRLIGRLKGQCTMILVTHDQNLMSFADHFYELSNGKLKSMSSSGTQNLAILSKFNREQP